MSGFYPRMQLTSDEGYPLVETPSPGSHLSMQSGLPHEGTGVRSLRHPIEPDLIPIQCLVPPPTLPVAVSASQEALPRSAA